MKAEQIIETMLAALLTLTAIAILASTSGCGATSGDYMVVERHPWPEEGPVARCYRFVVDDSVTTMCVRRPPACLEGCFESR